MSDITTGYGERVEKTLLTFLVVQACFTLWYGMSNSIVDSSGQPVTDPFQVILFGLAAVTTTGLQNLYPANQIVELIMSIQVIVGIALTGLIGFVLGNRIRYSS